MKPRCSICSLVIALGLGMAMTLLVASRADDSRALDQIMAEQAQDRQSGWRWLMKKDAESGAPRAAVHLDLIREKLESAPDEVLFDASDALRRGDLWDWDVLPSELVLREAALRAAGDDADRELVIRQMATCPLDADEQLVLPVLKDLVRVEDEHLQRRAIEVAFGWIGPERNERLMMLPLRVEEDTRRLVRVAVYWSQRYDTRAASPRSWARIDAEAARSQLQHSVTDHEGMAYVAALLAEHSLPRDEAVELARKWIVDLNNDRKRAGALLAALLGEHAELLVEAYEAASDGDVRTTQRAALMALGREVGDGDPLEFTHRAAHLPGGHINPDIVLCLLAAGYENAPRYLAKTPDDLAGEAIRARTLLAERFLPYWNIDDAVKHSWTEPIKAYFESLWIVWALMHRWQEFDPETRTWQ